MHPSISSVKSLQTGGRCALSYCLRRAVALSLAQGGDLPAAAAELETNPNSRCIGSCEDKQQLFCCLAAASSRWNTQERPLSSVPEGMYNNSSSIHSNISTNNSDDGLQAVVERRGFVQIPHEELQTPL